MLYIGLDIGCEGAIGVVDQEGSYVSVTDMPMTSFGKFKFIDGMELLVVLRAIVGAGKGRVYIEAPSAMIPGGGIIAASQIGRMLGGAVATVAIKGLPYELLSSQKWKTALGIAFTRGEKPTDREKKERSLNMARSRYPAAELSLQKHHNRAEALLIAEYGRRFNSGVV